MKQGVAKSVTRSGVSTSPQGQKPRPLTPALNTLGLPFVERAIVKARQPKVGYIGFNGFFPLSRGKCHLENSPSIGFCQEQSVREHKLLDVTWSAGLIAKHTVTSVLP